MNRSWLFVPGDRERMLRKADELGADALIFDLEDAVSASRKQIAREMLAEHLAGTARGTSERWVRINALASGEAAADLCAVLPGRPDGILLPKAEHGAQARTLDHYLEALEAAYGLPGREIRTAMIAFETPLSILNAASHVAASERCCALSWGAEDLAAGLGAGRSRLGDGQHTAASSSARTACLMAAAASDVQAVDTVYADFRDEAGLAEDCRAACSDGFTGKLAIHPGQVGTINAGFTPGREEVEHARAVMAAFEADSEAGAVSLDGVMLDAPHLRQARRTLQLAARGGERP